jgi:hypothetical protein
MPQPKTNRIDQKHETKFKEGRIAQSNGGFNGVVKARQILRQYDSHFYEPADNGTYPQMNE